MRTAPIRHPDSSQLLLALVAPHAPISSQTVSRWLKGALSLAGIAPTFTGHSTRSASAPAAAEASITLKLILDAADWASVETFGAFYCTTGLHPEKHVRTLLFHLDDGVHPYFVVLLLSSSYTVLLYMIE